MGRDADNSLAVQTLPVSTLRSTEVLKQHLDLRPEYLGDVLASLLEVCFGQCVGAGGFLVGSTGIIVSPSFLAILNCSSTLYCSCDVLPALVFEDFPKAFIEAPTDCRVILVES